MGGQACEAVPGVEGNLNEPMRKQDSKIRDVSATWRARGIESTHLISRQVAEDVVGGDADGDFVDGKE